MDITGERFIPDVDWPEISYEHWHRYLWAAQFAADRRVLDVGCGEGYGSHILARHARHVLGVDLDAASIEQASLKYRRANLHFLPGSAESLPVEHAQSYDLVVGFEMIEHLSAEGQQQFVAEVKRVLAHDGVFVVSTPDKRLYSEANNYVNDFHIHELYVEEFESLLGQSFGYVYLLGQKVFPTSHIWPLTEPASGTDELQLQYADGHFVPGDADAKQATFVIALCSDQPLDTAHLSLLLDTSGQVTFRTLHSLAEREAIIGKQHADVLELQGRVVLADQQLAKDASDIAHLQELVAARDEQLAKDASDIEALLGQIAAWQHRFAEFEQNSAADIAALQDQLGVYEAQRQKDAADIAALQDQLGVYEAQRQKDAADIAGLSAELTSFKTSLGGRTLLRVWQVRQRVLPSGSRPLRATRLAWRTARMLRAQGVKATVRHGAGWLRARQRAAPGTPHQPSVPAVPEDDYHQWYTAHMPSAAALAAQQTQALTLAATPTISMVLHVDAATPAALRATLASLRQQSYERWECWLLTSTISTSVLRDAITPVADGDKRIHLLSIKSQDEAVAMSEALGALASDWVCFVRPGDQLAPQALFKAISLLQTTPDADVLYSDSDQLQGHRHVAPLFKPDWSPALLLSLNYVDGMVLVRTSCLRAVGGVRDQSGSAWLWDVMLRLGDHTEAIYHLPEVLYHHATTAFLREPTSAAGQAAVLHHLERHGIPASAAVVDGALRLSWPLPNPPLVSIIIPSRDVHLVDRCVRSLEAYTDYRSFEVIIIDTSRDGSIAALYADGHQPSVHVLRDTDPFNYSLVNNRAAREAHGDLLLFLNDDIEAFEPGWLEELVRWATYGTVGVVGAQLLRSDNRLQHAGVVVGLHGFAGHPFDNQQATDHTIFGSPLWYRNYSAVTGACLLIRRAVFEAIGGFDDAMVLCGSDVELCLRVQQAGYQVMYTPFARLYHLESATRGGSAIPPLDFAYSYVHYLPLLEIGDPFYNPNVSAWSSQPQLRFAHEGQPLDHVRASLHQLGVADQAETLRTTHARSQKR